jgi:hypothetical protein
MDPHPMLYMSTLDNSPSPWMMQFSRICKQIPEMGVAGLLDSLKGRYFFQSFCVLPHGKKTHVQQQ